jgi:membrane protease YdiL (CAAX protease family)
LPLILTLLGFSVFWFVSHSEKIKSRFYDELDSENASIKHIIFTKHVGFVSMGVLPAIIAFRLMPSYSLADYGVAVNADTRTLTIISILVLSMLVVPMAFFSSKKSEHLLTYPQIRVKSWGLRLVMKNALGWTLYLIGYEFLFRGILLFPLVSEIGVWPAIAINTAMYSATHIPKGLNEAVGAVPLGIVLCLLTLMTGTLWIAIVVHIVMAWANSFSSVFHHPDMTFNLKK